MASWFSDWLDIRSSWPVDLNSTCAHDWCMWLAVLLCFFDITNGPQTWIWQYSLAQWRQKHWKNIKKHSCNFNIGVVLLSNDVCTRQTYFEKRDCIFGRGDWDIGQHGPLYVNWIYYFYLPQILTELPTAMLICTVFVLLQAFVLADKADDFVSALLHELDLDSDTNISFYEFKTFAWVNLYIPNDIMTYN